jgi:hypothetical protein
VRGQRLHVGLFRFRLQHGQRFARPDIRHDA